MATKRLNVLVFAGTGSGLGSVHQCLYSLRRALYPRYAVHSITSDVLLKEPWQDTCALLVMPGGRDRGYCSVLNGEGNAKIKQFVKDGGSYLGLCAGGYYGSMRCEFDVGGPLEVVEPRELAFYPDICRGSVFPGFVYDSEQGTRAAELAINKNSFSKVPFDVPDSIRTYFNGGGFFVNAHKHQQSSLVEILASYTEVPNSKEILEGDLSLDSLNLADSSTDRPAAVVYIALGKGHVILSGLHPEFAVANLSRNSRGMKESVYVALEACDQSRAAFFRALVRKLGLTVAESEAETPILTPMNMWSLDGHDAIVNSWKRNVLIIDGNIYFKGDESLFTISEAPQTPPRPRTVQEILPDAAAYHDLREDRILKKLLDANSTLKEIVPRSLDDPKPQVVLKHFDHDAYFSNLQSYTQASGQSHLQFFGRTLLYSKVTTSTSTLIEGNPQISNALPSGTTFLATTQVSGRGRGSNVWISAPGSLLFSTIIKHPMAQNVTAPVVFLQYVAALAVVEGIHTYRQYGLDSMEELRSYTNPFAASNKNGSRYRQLPVRLKWPNDIYALNPEKLDADPKDAASYIKIGGILANTSYTNGDFNVVIGIGLNMSNSAPTTSLNALVEAYNTNTPMEKMEKFRTEELLPRILSTFTEIYCHFLQYGFRGELEASYLKHWLHSDQVVTLEEEGHVKARIKGITMDWGSLVAEEVRQEGVGADMRTVTTGRQFALQADNNSFDFFKGLVRRKL